MPAGRPEDYRRNNVAVPNATMKALGRNAGPMPPGLSGAPPARPPVPQARPAAVGPGPAAGPAPAPAGGPAQGGGQDIEARVAQLSPQEKSDILAFADEAARSGRPMSPEIQQIVRAIRLSGPVQGGGPQAAPRPAPAPQGRAAPAPAPARAPAPQAPRAPQASQTPPASQAPAAPQGGGAGLRRRVLPRT